ncbi:MAG: hypothetical protein R2752_20065 [Vicinamibacterales bacterium]
MSGPESALTRLLRAGLACGVIDGLWAVVLTVIYQGTQARLFQGIAATVFGAGMFEAGAGGILLGVAMHFSVAFWWSAVFLLLVGRFEGLRRVLVKPGGTLAVAAIYGPIIWIVMSAVVIPWLTGRPLAITYRWWIQIAGHVVFVGLPIVWAIGPAPVRRRSG